MGVEARRVREHEWWTVAAPVVCRHLHAASRREPALHLRELEGGERCVG